jgi:MFS family permease
VTRTNLAIILPALGIAQIVSWGSLFYSIAVLAQPMQADLHLSRVQVFAGFSLALAISGLLSERIGRVIDARSGRYVLCRGALAGAVALTILAAAPNYPILLLGWCIGGVAMSMTLYDPAFATLSQLSGQHYRRALTGLTLIAGFASTVFWPLTQALVTHAGWRNTLLIFAALHLLVALPLVLAFIPAPVRTVKPDSALKQHASPSRPVLAQWWLAACFALFAFVFSSMSAHLVGLLSLKGLSSGQAVGLLSLIGPMQVTGRVLEMSFGARFSIAAVGIGAFALLIGALTLLLLVDGPGILGWMFVICYGCANGVITIVRGVLPAALFGRERLGGMLGWLARPSFIAQAMAPAAVALLLTWGSAQLVISVAAGAIMAALGCLVVALRVARRGS